MNNKLDYSLPLSLQNGYLVSTVNGVSIMKVSDISFFEVKTTKHLKYIYRFFAFLILIFIATQLTMGTKNGNYIAIGLILSIGLNFVVHLVAFFGNLKKQVVFKSNSAEIRITMTMLDNNEKLVQHIFDEIANAR